MARRKRLPFPKYLNRPRLWIRFESDEIVFNFLVAGVVTFLLFVMAVPLYVLVIVDVAVIYISHSIYKKLVKDAPPGFLSHFFYGIGLSNPNKKREKEEAENENEFRLPMGFEHRFVD